MLLSSEKIISNIDRNNINSYIRLYEIPENIIIQYLSVIDINLLCKYQPININLADYYYFNLNWDIICERFQQGDKSISNDVIIKYGYLVNNN